MVDYNVVRRVTHSHTLCSLTGGVMCETCARRAPAARPQCLVRPFSFFLLEYCAPCGLDMRSSFSVRDVGRSVLASQLRTTFVRHSSAPVSVLSLALCRDTPRQVLVAPPLPKLRRCPQNTASALDGSPLAPAHLGACACTCTFITAHLDTRARMSPRMNASMSVPSAAPRERPLSTDLASHLPIPQVPPPRGCPVRRAR